MVAIPAFTSAEAFTSTLLGGNLTESQLALMGAVFETGGLDELSGVLTVLQNPQSGGDISREQFAAAVYQVVSRDAARIWQLLAQARTSLPLSHSSIRFNQNPQEALAAVFGASRRKNSETRVGEGVRSPNSGGLRAQGAGTAAAASAAADDETHQIEEARKLIAGGKVQDGVVKLITLANALSTRGRAEDYSRIGNLYVEASLAMRRANIRDVTVERNGQHFSYDSSEILETAPNHFNAASNFATDKIEKDAFLAKGVVAEWLTGRTSQAEFDLNEAIIARQSRDEDKVLQVLRRMRGYMLSVPRPLVEDGIQQARYRLAIELLAQTSPADQTERLMGLVGERDTARLLQATDTAKRVVVPCFVEGVEKLLGPVLAGAFLSGVMPAETLAESRGAVGTIPATPVNDTEAERARALQLIESGDLAGGIKILYYLAWRAKSVGKFETAAELALDQAFALRNKWPWTSVTIEGGYGSHILNLSDRFYEAAAFYRSAAEHQTDVNKRVSLYMRAWEAGRLGGQGGPWTVPIGEAMSLGGQSQTVRVIEEMVHAKQANITGGRRGRPSIPGFAEEVRRLLGPRLSETFLHDLMPQGALPAPAPTAQVSKPATAGTVAPSTTPATIPIQADDQVRQFVRGAVRAQKIRERDLEKLASLLGPKVRHVVAVGDLRKEIKAGSGPLFDAFATLAGYTDANKQNLHTAIGHLIR